MALSGVIYGSTNNKYITCYISWSAVQNKIENYSDVTANLYYSRTNSGYSTHGTWNGAIGIDGNVVSASRSISITYNSNTFAIGNTVRVYHNNEGKKTLYINASGGISGTSLSSTNCGGTVTLDDIPRVSTLSCTNANVGENPTIYIGKADANYTDTITYSFGTLTGTIATDSLASQITSWTIPESFYDEMTTVSQKSCTLSTTTKNGDVTLGTNTYTFTVSVNPEICSPIMNPTVIDTNSVTKTLTGNENTLVKYYSTATATINAEARNGATIVSQTINSLETTGNAVFTNVQTNKFVFSVKDSRGLITSQTITKNMVDYLNLTSSIEVTIPTTDGKVTLKTNGLYFNGSFGAIDNSLTASYRISESGTWGNWISFTPTLKDNSYSAIVNITGLDYRLPYQFEVKLEDKLSNSSSVSQVVRAIPLFEWDDNSFDFHIKPTFDSNPLVIGDTNGNVPIIKGGTGGNTTELARKNLQIAMQPKLLWSGSWSSGSITVPDFSKYKFYFVQTSDGDGAFCWVDFSLLLGGGMYPLTGSGGQMVYTVRAHVDNDTLTLENSYAILRPKESINGGQYTRTIISICGLLLNDDVL